MDLVTGGISSLRSAPYIPLSAAVNTGLLADGADDITAGSELTEVGSLIVGIGTVVVVVLVVVGPSEVLKRDVLTSEICTVRSGTNLRLVVA